jgi:hypothetical protein
MAGGGIQERRAATGIQVEIRLGSSVRAGRRVARRLHNALESQRRDGPLSRPANPDGTFALGRAVGLPLHLRRSANVFLFFHSRVMAFRNVIGSRMSNPTDLPI